VTEEKLRELKEAFDFSDRDGNGKIDLLEFISLLEDFGVSIDTAQAQSGFETLDTDDDGMIDFDEFAAWWRAN
jgi:calmodulin/calcium-binding protein CML/plastin-2